MKKLTFLSLGFLTMLSLSLLFLYISSCKTDQCKGVNCVNGGVCTNGICGCTLGYEGVTCETKSNAKFVGKWNTVEVSGKGIPNAYMDTINASGITVDGVSIANFGNFGHNIITSDSVSGSLLLMIETQTIGGKTITGGSGKINVKGDSIVISYNYTDQNGNESSTGVWTKQ